LADGRVLVVGGTDGVRRGSIQDTPPLLRSTEIYDPKLDAWTDAPPLPGEHRTWSLRSVSLLDGRALIVGVASRSTDAIYDPAARAWTTLAPPAGLEDASVEWVGRLPSGVVLRVAGSSFRTGDTFGMVATLDPRGPSSWQRLEVRGRETAYRDSPPITCTVLRDGRVLESGGGLRSTKEAVLFDPVSATWRRTGDMALARDEHASVLLDTGRVLVVGGIAWTADGAIANVMSSEVYDPDTEQWRPR
jgi:hypothetical protein